MGYLLTSYNLRTALFLIFIAFSFLSDIAHATSCYVRAGRYYKIDPDLLLAIAWKESRLDKHAIGQNPRGGYGTGLMQVDSQHFKELKTYGITPHRLLNDSCLNIYTGAYYLAIAFRKFGRTWQAVGAYNAGFKINKVQNHRRFLYASDVKRIYLAIKRKKSSAIDSTHLAKESEHFH
ncbi:transglycosylase SLT domain-containing protein [Salmonella enterica]|nr:lytic transglycosylase [Salmonella enterica subsp. enterica]EDZ5417339.1 transglycosylase SLT domain-containing protein [Salmonella enterica subsp. enterica serovar Muenchen]EHF1675573.1 transglycosylase SLT domain-containing protein [Salmonella enterica subsp. enterica serovar Bredeney]EHM9798895.1 transglycosylase SLT domain-containing protein [Salmonella enterica]EDU9994629.1 transglycosylase SLT domain-containing protein [Salmonella enterica subsp. enterica]